MQICVWQVSNWTVLIWIDLEPLVTSWNRVMCKSYHFYFHFISPELPHNDFVPSLTFTLECFHFTPCFYAWIWTGFERPNWCLCSVKLNTSSLLHMLTPVEYHALCSSFHTQHTQRRVNNQRCCEGLQTRRRGIEVLACFDLFPRMRQNGWYIRAVAVCRVASLSRADATAPIGSNEMTPQAGMRHGKQARKRTTGDNSWCDWNKSERASGVAGINISRRWLG